MSEQLALLPGYLTAHLQLTLLALLAGIAVSVPAGILVARARWLEQPVLGVASVIQTIPSLALLAIMVPLLAAVDLPSIGFLPAFIGLALYSVLPVLRNTVAGLCTVDPALVEAARGVGMTPGQRLRQVELPLAMPVIIAGVRTSTVWTVGMATLSTPVGAPSLGNYIFSGLQTRNFTAVLVGCVAAAGLALSLDALVRALALAVERRQRTGIWVVLGLLALLYGYTGVTLWRDFASHNEQRVRIGTKTFTEQYILAEVLAGQLERRAGLAVETLQSLGSTVAFDALRNDQIDVYVDYSGTIWATIMRRAGLPEDRRTVLDQVRRYLLEEHGVTLVAALGFENAYALAMRRTHAQRLGIQRVGQLAPHAGRMSMGGDYEFFGRPEWKAIQSAYGLKFREQRSMDSSLMYQAATQGAVDVISAFSTDGRIAALDLVVLEDERGAIPPYDAVILAGPALVKHHPAALGALRRLEGTIDADHMRRMNLAVDRDKHSPAKVAQEFLASLEQRDAPGHPDASSQE